jgi:hypothetical protein
MWSLPTKIEVTSIVPMISATATLRDVIVML